MQFEFQTNYTQNHAKKTCISGYTILKLKYMCTLINFKISNQNVSNDVYHSITFLSFVQFEVEPNYYYIITTLSFFIIFFIARGSSASSISSISSNPGGVRGYVMQISLV